MARSNRGRKKKRVIATVRLPENVKNELVGFSSDFMVQYLSKNSIQSWTLRQRKLFAIVLERIDWTDSNNNIVEINNMEAAKALGWAYGEDDTRKIGKILREEFTCMTFSSGVALQNPHSKKWLSANLINKAEGNSTHTYVTLEPAFMPHFERLYEYTGLTGKTFYTILAPDLLIFETDAGSKLFMELRSHHTKKGAATYQFTFSTKHLKDIFGLSAEAYMRDKDPLTGQWINFNRSMFERGVIIPAIEDVNRTEQVQILQFEDGKYFKKVKEGKKVKGYTFKWRVLDTEHIEKQRAKNLKDQMLEDMDYIYNMTKLDISKPIEIETDLSDLE